MKKMFLVSTAVGMILTAGAQVQPSANRGGVYLKGGANFANITVSTDGRVDDAHILTTFHAGLGFDAPLARNFSLQPAILLSGKGAKTEYNTENDPTYWKATSNPLYVEVPLNLVAKIHLDEYSRFIFGAGPYGAIGVGGKNKIEGKLLGASFTSEEHIDFSNDNPATSAEEGAGYGKLKRFDYGLNAVAGIEFNKFNLTANYGYGLAKLNSNTINNADDEGKNRVLSLSLGIKL